MFSWWCARAFLVFVVSSRWCGRGDVLHVEYEWYLRGVGRCVRGSWCASGVHVLSWWCGRAWWDVNVALGRGDVRIAWSWCCARCVLVVV